MIAPTLVDAFSESAGADDVAMMPPASDLRLTLAELRFTAVISPALVCAVAVHDQRELGRRLDLDQPRPTPVGGPGDRLRVCGGADGCGSSGGGGRLREYGTGRFFAAAGSLAVIFGVRVSHGLLCSPGFLLLSSG